MLGPPGLEGPAPQAKILNFTYFLNQFPIICDSISVVFMWDICLYVDWFFTTWFEILLHLQCFGQYTTAASSPFEIRFLVFSPFFSVPFPLRRLRRRLKSVFWAFFPNIFFSAVRKRHKRRSAYSQETCKKIHLELNSWPDSNTDLLIRWQPPFVD